MNARAVQTRVTRACVDARRRGLFLALIAAVAMLPLALPTAAGAQALQPIVTTDLLRVRTVSSIDVAADGSRAVLVVRSVGDAAPPGAAEPRYVNQSHLYLLDLRGGNEQPRQVTFGDRRDRAAVLSPNGRQIAFVRDGPARPARDDDDDDPPTKPQVWIMSLEGGGEARPVTDMPHGATRPAWSPDGRKLVVQSTLPLDELDEQPGWPLERPGRTWDEQAPDPQVEPDPAGSRDAIRAWLLRNERTANPRAITRLSFQDEQALKDQPRFAHLFLIDLHRGDGTPVRLTRGAYDHTQHAVLPDGSGVVYVASKPTVTHPDRVRDRAIYHVGLDGSSDQVVLAMDGWRLSRPKPSRDSTVVAFTARRTEQEALQHEQLGMVVLPRARAAAAAAASSADGAADRAAGAPNEPIWLTTPETFDFAVRDFTWRHPAAALVFSTAREGGFPLLTVSPGLIRPAPLLESTDGALPFGIHEFDVGGGTLVYTRTTWDNPCTVHVQDARGDRLVLDLNEWTADRTLSEPEGDWITRPDGTRVQYWLIPPTNRLPGRRYPLALEIHGGPMVMWGPGERTMWLEFQLLCSWGYGVVYANPRGSGGYGSAFVRANVQNWGAGPTGDVLAAVDAAVLEPWVDPEQLVVTGGSYGGYLTAYVLTQDKRFKAAVAQRGVYDLTTFFGEGNAWRLLESAMGGFPYQSSVRSILQRESPFSMVARITTPLLILHADNDLRTGVSQSAMLYRALKQLERPVEYVRYPDAGHDLSRTGDPTQRMDRLNRIIEFFERFIDNPRAAPRAR